MKKSNDRIKQLKGNKFQSFDDLLAEELTDARFKEDFEKEKLAIKNNSCNLGGDTSNNCADCVNNIDYHSEGGICVERED